ncbi:protein kinase [Roseobacter sp. HKCCD9010]|uniref:serine/threonine-protein kinase n=1 Tax=unclassified Roseobacter TaxID=196798 RepID=UPI0014931F30|nr:MULTISPECIES: protein kinase [unclassified Roseobacter]MBF9051701.1 protein kinase [Rhodobacterales bacterium HKCCD4356]NNV13225.1 protein kinase [Roseobacter sp. HKCCD7357]NNV17476.1 protein kinase [Roseobacter sp. HKCCD8768]NNV27082.1 protein kinase [Roseobacter sp. HKCCD8192]NNV31202.1 protein kinase [Roseobacter sp. HKCCD9061]
MNEEREVEFNRPAKFRIVEELGAGACGVTVRLRDDGMDAEFVAKKYQPIVSRQENKELFDDLLLRFRDEARTLFRLNHPNVVRVFNFFDYEEYGTSYILMEYVSGMKVLDFIQSNPASAERVFEEVVDGFAHLQQRGVLHRDIRPANILVTEEGAPKIIDFGFGKRVEATVGKPDEKSISLNWWCEKPPEFADGIYDFQTEVYFVGKLFQLAVEEYGLSDFKFRALLGKMCDPDRGSRCKDFWHVKGQVTTGSFTGLAFSEEEIASYRDFSNGLSEVAASIRADAKFERDATRILTKLEELHRKTMLEEVLPAPNKLLQVFVQGGFSYFTSVDFEVQTLERFLDLFRGLSDEKRGVVIDNLQMRLEACERTYPDMDDEIPF